MHQLARRVQAPGGQRVHPLHVTLLLMILMLMVGRHLTAPKMYVRSKQGNYFPRGGTGTAHVAHWLALDLQTLEN